MFHLFHKMEIIDIIKEKSNWIKTHMVYNIKTPFVKTLYRVKYKCKQCDKIEFKDYESVDNEISKFEFWLKENI